MVKSSIPPPGVALQKSQTFFILVLIEFLEGRSQPEKCIRLQQDDLKKCPNYDSSLWRCGDLVQWRRVLTDSQCGEI